MMKQGRGDALAFFVSSHGETIMDDFPLTVTVPAEEWSGLQRRARYLEAALIQAYRHERQLKEWFSISDLLGLELPGLPCTRQGILSRAKANGWQTRSGESRGGEQYEFHFSTLPRRAFEALIARIIAPVHTAPRQTRSRPPTAPTSDNTAPPWLLPLMRIVRSDQAISLDEAYHRLDATLPPGLPLPDPYELEIEFNKLRQKK